MPGTVRDRPLVVLCGPTAVGKSDVAVLLAERIGGEIVCADSRTVYRGMDIGSAKPSPAARARVRHHVIDVADPRETFTVVGFQRFARAAIKQIRARGAWPLLVGGAGFYMRAAVDAVPFPRVTPNWELRAALEDQECRAPGSLHARLARVDPVAAARLHPANVRRIVRAIEVVALTGAVVPVAERGASEPDARWFGFTMPREALHARIEARVRSQLAAGLVEEVRALLAAGVPPQAASMQGVGYKEMVGVARGIEDLDTAVAALLRNTRRYAKRQYTWFRAEPRVAWIDVANEAPAATAADIAARLRAAGFAR